MIHVAITRTVRPGYEQELEQRVAEILRTFFARRRDRFHRSEVYRRFTEAIAPLVEGPPLERDIRGLEVELLVGNTLVISLLAWVLMPLLTRVLAKWLRAPPRQGTSAAEATP